METQRRPSNRRNMAKSVYDASWFQLRQLLKYKANTLGVGYVEVNEAYTTQTCNVCQEKTGPKGLKDLSVREWGCGCGASHNRDVNAAQNILRLGHQTPKGNPRSSGRGRMSIDMMEELFCVTTFNMGWAQISLNDLCGLEFLDIDETHRREFMYIQTNHGHCAASMIDQLRLSAM